MLLATGFVLAGVASVLALPRPEAAIKRSPPNEYTLSVFAPQNDTLNGLKAELNSNLWLYQERVNSYCPLPAGCPKGNHTAFGSGMYPGSLVPGGQTVYVTADGEFRVTPQHSHSIPSDAFQAPSGWSWIALGKETATGLETCPQDNKKFRCCRPTGYYTFRAPQAREGGLVACPKKFGDQDAAVIYAVTPNFKQTGCSPVEGLATHDYKGPYPPVYSYY